MGAKYKIKAILTDDLRHCPYILKGLLDLEQQGIIELDFYSASILFKNRWIQDGSKGFRSKKGYPWFVELEAKNLANGATKKIGLDLQDWENMFSYHSIKNSDVIYKRALIKENVDKLSADLGVLLRPLGPNHSVVFNDKRIDNCVKWSKRKQLIGKILSEPKKAIITIIEKIKPKKVVKISSNNNLIEIKYNQNKPPKQPYIFFQVQFHDWEDNQYSKGLNEMRAQLIRTFRNEFGSNFVGGMFVKGKIDPAFADCITDVNPTPENYKLFVENAAVVISTNGFGNSIPWKLTEYLKWGCCIVSEKNIHAFRVNLPEGVLKDFTEISEAVSICKTLLNDEKLRNSMKQNAMEYYQKTMEPSVSLLGILDDAFEK